MRTHYLFSMFVLLSMSLFSCAKHANFEPHDAKFIFSLRDIMSLDLSGFHYEKLSNGKYYFYAKSDDDQNGHSYFYGEKLVNGGKADIALTTSVNIQSDETEAVKLYKTSMMVPIINKAKTSALNPLEYNIDEGFVARIHNAHVINLRKGNLFYQIWIEGVESLNENQFKDSLIKKINYILHNSGVV